jgi:hypothetical protein
MQQQKKQKKKQKKNATNKSKNIFDLNSKNITQKCYLELKIFSVFHFKKNLHFFLKFLL